MNKEEIVNNEILKKQYDSIKDLNNKELRRVIENSNWNFILQIIRYLENENKDLKEKNEFLIKRDNKCQMLEQVIKEAREYVKEEFEYSKIDCEPAIKSVCKRTLEILSKGENK